MAGEAGTIIPPKLETPNDYRDFMRSEAGSKIKPGSEEEKLIIDGFKAARHAHAETSAKTAVGTKEQPGPLSQELGALEEARGSYVRPEDSQAAHHPNEITITKVDGEDGPVPVQHAPGPLEANNNPETGLIDAAKLSPNPAERPSAEQKPL